MTSLTNPPPGLELVPITAETEGGSIGVVTRLLSWGVDAGLIILVSTVTALAVSLFLSIIPLSQNLEPVFKAAAGTAFIVWCAAYFVTFWSTTGQTPGARLMQIRLVTPSGDRLKPGRALLRWIAMNLAALPFGAGYLPILVGRRGFPDWFAHTLVLEAPQLSLARARMIRLRAARSADGAAPAGAPPRPKDGR